MGDVSATRLYLGNLPRNATKADVENHFNTHGTGEITEIKLMNGFGFIEYKDAMDARDVVPAFHGSEFMGERLVVQFARGSTRPREGGGFPEHRAAPRPRRTLHRMTITGLPVDTSWQDLKDFARQSGLDVVYSEVSRERDGANGGKGYVEYETAEDLAKAVAHLDSHQFKEVTVRCISDPQTELPRPRERFRSRSPGYRGRAYPPVDDYYERRGPPPPRGYSPRRDDYRRRSPPPQRGRYEEYDRAPYAPRGREPIDDGYGPPRRAYAEDPYARAPLPPRGDYREPPYANGGHGRPPYGGPPPSRRTPPRGDGYGGGYDNNRDYWQVSIPSVRSSCDPS